MNKSKYDPAIGFFNEGTFYPHKRFCINSVDITAPAKIDYSGDRARHAQRHGEYLYALPAGGAVTESGRVV